MADEGLLIYSSRCPNQSFFNFESFPTVLGLCKKNPTSNKVHEIEILNSSAMKVQRQSKQRKHIKNKDGALNTK